ncbi:lysophospholipase [Chitinophaga pendula]|uniref:alpha/beta hydrolase n=1 Tax=Chitinophaga TaxID=79328 RepID=UPI000BAFA13F|nr:MULTISPECIES: alpha/beta fold hydrolase [Chitinophaga]ASZ12216.1 hypothetical protein CK934_15225 [Chitinophaga sp. MD30]UCJ04754.1 lysophospholipase [Chitinophaga pendula]
MRKTGRQGLGLLLYALCSLVLYVAPCYVHGQSAAGKAPDSSKLEQQGLQLIHKPEPVFRTPAVERKDSVTYPGFPYRSRVFTARDGNALFTYHFPQKGSKTIVLLLHGVLSSADKLNYTAGLLRATLNSDVYAMDHRGHGRSGGQPGDVSYTGQYEDDIADIIGQLRRRYPHHKIILAGHSMGGGIALRYALKTGVPPVAAYLLFAPLLGPTAPTIRMTAPPMRQGEEPFLKIHLSRIFGLKMLNTIGQHQYDSLRVLFFHVPDGSRISSYSYRANESMCPADYKAAFAAIRQPLLVLVGSRDEAFVPAAFEPAVKNSSQGVTFVIEGATHNSVRHDSTAMERIKQWAIHHQI